RTHALAPIDRQSFRHYPIEVDQTSGRRPKRCSGLLRADFQPVPDRQLLVRASVTLPSRTEGPTAPRPRAQPSLDQRFDDLAAPESSPAIFLPSSHLDESEHRPIRRPTCQKQVRSPTFPVRAAVSPAIQTGASIWADRSERTQGTVSRTLATQPSTRPSIFQDLGTHYYARRSLQRPQSLIELRFPEACLEFQPCQRTPVSMR